MLSALAAQGPGFRFTDAPVSAGLTFRHNTGAYGAKYLPETMGPGCAFLDYDSDGWLDVLLVNGPDWPGHKRQRSTLRLLRNNRNGTFTDVTRAAGLEIEMYGLGVAVGDFNNDGFPDLYLTAVGQNRLVRNDGRGRFHDVTDMAGLGSRRAFSTSALWFDFDRDGHLDLFVCNYVRWSPGADVFCSLNGENKSYCTPEAYRGSTCWLFRNKGDGTFEEVTATSGVFDPSSKSLGVAMLDVDGNGWPDLFVANDTQPNKLYRNQRNGKFIESAVPLGVAFSEDGRARAGMGVDAGDYRRSGQMGIAVTNFDNEMMALYEPSGRGFVDRAMATGVGAASRQRLGFGCLFGDFDRDGDLDLLITTNGGAAYLYRCDVANGNRSIRFRLEGRRSNRDAIGAVVQIHDATGMQMQMVKSGSSYLSSSDKALTFGVARRELVDRAVIFWPSGRTDEFRKLGTNKSYVCVEGKAIRAQPKR